MKELNINIDDSLLAFVEEQRVQGGYGTIDAYFQSLVEDDRQRLNDQAYAQKRFLEIARAKGRITQEDHERIYHEIVDPRLEPLRKMIKEGTDSLDRGEGIAYESEDELLADIKRLAAEMNAGRLHHKT